MDVPMTNVQLFVSGKNGRTRSGEHGLIKREVHTGSVPSEVHCNRSKFRLQ